MGGKAGQRILSQAGLGNRRTLNFITWPWSGWLGPEEGGGLGGRSNIGRG